MKARIFKPAKTSMQSGYRNTKNWVLEFEPEPGKRYIDNIMGWTGSADMEQEVRLKFKTREAAIECAKRLGLDYEVSEPKSRKVKPKSYADNFKYKPSTAA